jgi:hypothetical protein
MPSSADDRFWSVEVPGLSEGEAKQLAEFARTNQLGWFGSATLIDPGHALTLHLDRDSARLVYDGLMSNPGTATPEHGLAAVIRDWLDAGPSGD